MTVFAIALHLRPTRAFFEDTSAGGARFVLRWQLGTHCIELRRQLLEQRRVSTLTVPGSQASAHFFQATPVAFIKSFGHGLEFSQYTGGCLLDPVCVLGCQFQQAVDIAAAPLQARGGPL